MILAGDVGGTKANLALGEKDEDGGVRFVREETYSSRDHDGLEGIVAAFLDSEEREIECAAFGLAGPKVGDRIEMTNLGWTVEESRVREAIGLDEVTLLNDLEATVYGLDALGPDQVATLQEGIERGRTRALLAAGTGLGAAIIVEVDGRPVALPTESGHVDYAPRNDGERALLEWLEQKHERVSFERIVSGPGLHSIYRFLKETGRAQEPAWLAERLAGAEDPSAVISDVAMEEDVEICDLALDRFVAAYGAAAGNLALTSLALGGVYLGGGIAPKILPRLRNGVLLEAFRAKGRMRDLLSQVPVRVVTEPRTALIGAARFAMLPSSRPA